MIICMEVGLMKRNKRILTVMLCVISAVVLSFQVYAKTTEEKISDAKKEADEQQQKLDEANESLNSLEDSKAQLEGSLAALNSKLETLSNEVTDLESELDEKQQEIDETQIELDEASKVEEEQFESMKMRIKYLYELGNDTTMLQMMLEEKNFADILNKADYYSKITEYDRKELIAYQETKEKIEASKKLLEDDKSYIETLLSQKADKQAQIQTLVNDTSKEIAKQQQNIEEAQAAALAYEKELEEKMSTVSNLQAQLAYEKALKEKSKNGVFSGPSSGSYNIETSKSGYENASGSSDLDVMAAIIYCEAGAEPYQGQLAVGSVIMNRIYSSGFPDTLLGVLYQKSQFTPVMSGRFAVVLANGLATSSCYQAANEVLNGTNVVPDCLFFRTVIDGIDGQIIGTQIFY